MARIKIFRRDGTPSPYFWSDKEAADATHKAVYKETTQGVKKMTGVHYDATTKRIVKH